MTQVNIEGICCLKKVLGGGSTGKVDLSPLEARLKALETKEDKDTLYNDTALQARLAVLEGKIDKDTIYDDTDVKNEITALREAIQNKVDSDNQTLTATPANEGVNLSISGGNIVLVKDDWLYAYMNTLENSQLDIAQDVQDLKAKEDNDKQTLSLTDHTLSISNGNSVELPKTDLTPVENRLSTLENKVDNDTVYDDTALVARVSALEAKQDSDNQALNLTGKKLSISNGNEVELPVYDKTEIDTKLQEYYTKAQTQSTEEINQRFAEKDREAKSLTHYVGTYVNSVTAPNGASNTTPTEIYRTLTYNTTSGLGILHIDFKTSYTNQGRVVLDLPANAPTPKNLIETQVSVEGGQLIQIYIDKGTRQVKANLNTNTVGKRIIGDLMGFWE